MGHKALEQADEFAGIRHRVQLAGPFEHPAPKQLRQTAATLVASAASGKPNSLAALGITTAPDGKLSISNETTLKDKIKSDPTAVQTVFTAAADGVATKLEDFVDDYTSVGGRIAETQNLLSTRIRGLSSRITTLKATLEKKQLALQNQLARDQSLIIALTRQLTQVQRFFGVQGTM